MELALRKIVDTWNIKKDAEYRNYRCANCQKPIRKAYQYLLNDKGFKVFVHFCKNCNKDHDFPKTKFNVFKCDNCLRPVFKSWHIWKREEKMRETHLCNNCKKLMRF